MKHKNLEAFREIQGFFERGQHGFRDQPETSQNAEKSLGQLGNGRNPSVPLDKVVGVEKVSVMPRAGTPLPQHLRARSSQLCKGRGTFGMELSAIEMLCTKSRGLAFAGSSLWSLMFLPS